MSKESEKSIICGDGGLLINRDTMTWQTALQIERDVNSEQGGWNSASFWEAWGLDRLTESANGTVSGREFLGQWTQQSLAEKAFPKPRLFKFQLGLRNKAGVSGRRGKKLVEYPNPLEIRTEPSQPEHRLNWRLYMALRREKKLTYELPLCAESDGLLRADLVHFVPVPENGLVEIIELKKGLGKNQNESRDSPLMALVEAICYGLQLLRCWDDLQKELKMDLDVEPFEIKHLHLILAAPDFGKNCSGAGTELKCNQAEKLRAIVRTVEQVITAQTVLPNLPHPNLKLSFGNVIESEWTLEEVRPEERALPSGSLLKAKSK